MTALETRIYDRHAVIAFRKTGEAFGGLSNMAPGFPIEICGWAIRTSEALYQACRFPDLPEVQELILRETSPMTAKMRSKPYRDKTRDHWDQIRVPIMKWCLRVKLAQNWSTFGELLLETGNRSIVEDSRKDDFWGAIPRQDGSLCGRNVLGRLLMELREKLRANPESLKFVEPVRLPHFLLLRQEIPTIICSDGSFMSIRANGRRLKAHLVQEEEASPQGALWSN